MKYAWIGFVETKKRPSTKTSLARSDIISRNPATLQLRYLQTLSEIGIEQNSTVVFPLPMDLIKPLLGAVEDAHGQLERGNGEPRLFAPREREHAT